MTVFRLAMGKGACDNRGALGRGELALVQTILVVDDERNIVELARLYLSREGYKVLVSGNGREALEIVREKRPDLVVLDIMLPEMG